MGKPTGTTASLFNETKAKSPDQVKSKSDLPLRWLNRFEKHYPNCIHERQTPLQWAADALALTLRDWRLDIAKRDRKAAQMPLFPEFKTGNRARIAKGE